MDKSSSFRFNMIAVVAVAVTSLYVGLVLFPSYLNHDVSWILYSSRQLLNGGTFGTDVIDVNPPLAWWLSIPPVFVTELLNISLANSFRLYVLLLVAIAMLLLKRTNSQLENWQIVVTGMVLTVLPGYEFGQREHLMVILVTPYLGSLLSGEKSASGSTRFVTGVLAGIGICLKPYFLLIPICVEIYRMIKTRRVSTIIRIETIAMVLVGLVYVGAALIFAPTFFTDILPLALAGYNAYSNPVLLVALALIAKAEYALLAVLLMIIAGTRWGIGSVFFAAAIGAAISVLVQGKGWDYQVLPVISFLLLAICLSVNPVKISLFAVAGLLLFSITLATKPARQISQLAQPGYQRSLVKALDQRFSSLPINKRTVFAFIVSPRFIWPAILESDARWTGAQCCVFLLPAAVNNPDNKQAQANADQQLKAIVKTLAREKPSLIVIKTNQAKAQLAFRKPNFDYIKFLQQRPAYASLFTQYKETESIGYFRVFEKQTPWGMSYKGEKCGMDCLSFR